MSFRQFGGLQFASKHNAVASHYNTSNNLIVTKNVGQPNSYINFLSDISGNQIFGNVDVSGNLNVSGDIDCSGNVTAEYMFLSSNTITTYSNGVVPKSYVDTLGSGLHPYGQVKAISTSSSSSYNTQYPVPINTDITITTANPFLIDGISIVLNNNVLLNDQDGTTAAVTNGVYTLINTSGNIYRFLRSTAIFKSGSDSKAAYISVVEGTVNSLSGWVQTNEDASDIVGTTPLIFSKYFSFAFKLGEGLYPTQQDEQIYINVDSSLNFINYIDGSNNDTINIGTNTDTINIGKVSAGNNKICVTTSSVGINNNDPSPSYVLDVSGNTNVKGISLFTQLSQYTTPQDICNNAPIQINNISDFNDKLILTAGNTNNTAGTIQYTWDTDATIFYKQLQLNPYGGSVFINKVSPNYEVNSYALDVSGNVNITSAESQLTIKSSSDQSGFILADGINNQLTTSNFGIMKTGQLDGSKIPFVITNTGIVCINCDNGYVAVDMTSGAALQVNNSIYITDGSNNGTLYASIINQYESTLNIKNNYPGGFIYISPSGASGITILNTGFVVANSGMSVTGGNLTVTGNNSIVVSTELGTGSVTIVNGSAGFPGYVEFFPGNVATESRAGYIGYSDPGNTILQLFADTIYTGWHTNRTFTVDGLLTALGGISVTGTITASGIVNAAGFNTPSDYRIKENVTQLDSKFVVDNLNPVTYLNNKLGKQDIGLIAHELQEIYPELVNGEKDGENLQSVNYIGLIPILIKEIQELKKEIKSVKIELNELKNK
jgi:hypothetical protein